MIKNVLLILLMISGCSEVDNGFSKTANEFLNSVNGKVYTGKNTGAGYEFEINGKALAVFIVNAGDVTTDMFDPVVNGALLFQNSRGGGSSSTEGIYQQNKSGKWIGVVRSESVLKHTPMITATDYAQAEANLNWNSLTEFATEKKK